MEIFLPDDLLAKFWEIRDSLTAREFFSKPGMSRVRELWCAAHFARAYGRFFEPCQVRIAQSDDQSDIDFELGVTGIWHPFQIAEVLNPDRRRSDEYKRGYPKDGWLESWNEGTVHGPEWIRMAILNKLKKQYSTVRQLNLLLYLNFPAYDKEYTDIRSHCANDAVGFASVWLMTSHTICRITDGPDLLPCPGWQNIPESN